MKKKVKLYKWFKGILTMFLVITIALMFVPSQGQILSRTDSKISLIRLETKKIFLIPFKFPKIKKETVRYVFPSGTPIMIRSTFDSNTNSTFGTVTFVEPRKQIFSAFGNNIDSELVENVEQEILKVEEVDIADDDSEKKLNLKCLFPKRTSVDNSSKIFYQSSNCVIGKTTGENLIPSATYPIPIAFKEEIVTKENAYIISNTSNCVASYKIKVDKVNWEKNQIDFTVIDPELILKGGIMKGMSGSPIVQNGKLIGAVSRVIIADRNKGEAICAEVLIEECIKY